MRQSISFGLRAAADLHVVSRAALHDGSQSLSHPMKPLAAPMPAVIAFSRGYATAVIPVTVAVLETGDVSFTRPGHTSAGESSSAIIGDTDSDAHFKHISTLPW